MPCPAERGRAAVIMEFGHPAPIVQVRVLILSQRQTVFMRGRNGCKSSRLSGVVRIASCAHWQKLLREMISPTGVSLRGGGDPASWVDAGRLDSEAMNFLRAFIASGLAVPR